MINTVLFDVGGTLLTVQSSDALRTAFSKRLRERLAVYGITLSSDDVKSGQRLHENAEEYKHFSEEALTELPPVKIWNEFYLKEYKLGEKKLVPIAEELSFLFDYERVCNLRRPGLIETLDALRGMDIRMGVVSNIISRSFVPHILKEYGIESYFDCVVMSSESGYRKPNPAAFEPALRQLGSHPESTAYVGDTLSRDVLGAQNAKLAMMILIENPAIAHRDAQLIGTGLKPDYRIRTLLEVPEIISEYNKEHA